MEEFEGLEIITLLLDSSRGIYIPHDFAIWHLPDDNDECIALGINPEDRDFLRSEKSHEKECYWMVWQDILDHYIDADGNGLLQDGDLFLVKFQGIYEEDSLEII